MVGSLEDGKEVDLFFPHRRERAFTKFSLTWRSSPSRGRRPREEEYLKVKKEGVTRKTAVDDYFGTTFNAIFHILIFRKFLQQAIILGRIIYGIVVL